MIFGAKIQILYEILRQRQKSRLDFIIVTQIQFKFLYKIRDIVLFFGVKIQIWHIQWIWIFAPKNHA